MVDGPCQFVSSRLSMVVVAGCAFVYGGRAGGGELTRLAAAALGKARAEVREAAAELRADPRLTAMVEETEDAMNRPLPVADRPAENPVVSPRSDQRAPVSSAHRQQPPTDSYDDYDPYYHRKSWLVD
ncbi:hypothetical protein [Nocardia terpenica]|uniref:hypothetical protein n=1 Tax=Nocardia terpenica TaxID=455432 RepID=UPI0012FD408F|nr:hypothetical protein [Nocardia terpenica]